MNRLVVTACTAALIAACGGSSSSDINNSGGNSSGYTLDDVCERIAPKICTIRKPCCDKTNGYDEAGCLAHTKASCAKDVADARAGLSTFHPERIDGCLAKAPELFDSCVQTVDFILRALDSIHGCQTFEGQLGEGATCERDSQCKPGPGATDATNCSKDKKSCHTTTVVAAGGACSLTDGIPLLCGKGLFCDVAGSKTLMGTCKMSTPIGTPCDAKANPSLECGLGNSCDKATALCVAGKGGDVACTESLECASLQCDGSGPGGKKCVSPKPIIGVEECKGP